MGKGGYFPFNIALNASSHATWGCLFDDDLPFPSLIPFPFPSDTRVVGRFVDLVKILW